MVTTQLFIYLSASLVAGLAAALLLTVFFGAPYLPTRRQDAKKAVMLAKLKPGQTMVDLGCGDGRLLLSAASKGIRAVGYEINPFLAGLSWLRGRAYPGLIKVRLCNYWQQELPDETAAVFVFSAGPFMGRLDRYLKRHVRRVGRSVSLISYAFTVPGRRPIEKRGPLLVYRIDP